MPLRIILDTRRVADFGIGTYIRNLVRSLANLDRINHYTLITPTPAVPEFADLPSNFETAHYQRKGRSGFAQLGYTFFLHQFTADLHHIPLNAVPLWMPKPYVVTIHDMSTLLFADQKGYRNNLRLFYLRRGLLRADRVLAVSSATRRDVESVLGIPPKRVQVVYNAPDPAFCQSELLPWPGQARRNMDILPKSSASWIGTGSTIRSCFTSDERTRRKIFPAW